MIKKSSLTPLVLKRIHSLFGVFPLGVFLLQHFFSNSYGFVSREAFNEHSEFLTHLPLVYLLEAGAIYFPILFHGIFGAYIIYRGDNNVVSYSTTRNWAFLFQRLTGIAAFVFIIVHVWTTRLSAVFFHKEINFEVMSRILADPFWFWFYLIGMLSAVYHFANGIWSFLITWGITIGEKSQRAVAALMMLFFVVMGAWGLSFFLMFGR